MNITYEGMTFELEGVEVEEDEIKIGRVYLPCLGCEGKRVFSSDLFYSWIEDIETGVAEQIRQRDIEDMADRHEYNKATMNRLGVPNGKEEF